MGPRSGIVAFEGYLYSVRADSPRSGACEGGRIVNVCPADAAAVDQGGYGRVLNLAVVGEGRPVEAYAFYFI